MIYLDYNATTPLAREALEAMLPFLQRHHGNPSSIHQAGREARAAIDSARDRIAAILRVKPSELIFTSGGTESDNLGIIGLARAQRSKGRHLVTSTTEHHAVLHAFDFLEKHEGYKVTRLPVDHAGRIDPEQVREALTPDSTLVSIMSANNETGVLQSVKEIAAVCRERGVLFHTDAVQSFGKEPLEARDFDALSIAAHKFHGPKGAGVLYLRAGLSIEPMQFGGSHENQRRAGTENVAAIAGMAAAAGLAATDLATECERQTRLRDRLWSGIATACPQAQLNGAEGNRLPNTVNVSFPGLDGEGLLMNLDLAGICASSGSACMVGSIMPSHVLLAMGVAPELANSTVRFSLGKETTAAEIEEVLALLPGILERLQPQPL